jgi:hypothetical protein
MSIRKGPVLIAAVVVALTLLVWLVGRGPEPGPEAQVQRLIDESIEDVEEGEVGDLMDRVSDSYKGQGGDRRELRTYLTALLFRGGVNVSVLNHQIEINGETARVEMKVVLVRGGLSGAAEGDVGARTVVLDLAREDGDWMVVGSQVD